MQDLYLLWSVFITFTEVKIRILLPALSEGCWWMWDHSDHLGDSGIPDQEEEPRWRK